MNKLNEAIEALKIMNTNDPALQRRLVKVLAALTELLETKVAML